MNSQDFETGQDIIRALQTANHQIGSVLKNLLEHPERLRGVGVRPPRSLEDGLEAEVAMLRDRLAKSEAEIGGLKAATEQAALSEWQTAFPNPDRTPMEIGRERDNLRAEVQRLKTANNKLHIAMGQIMGCEPGESK